MENKKWPRKAITGPATRDFHLKKKWMLPSQSFFSLSLCLSTFYWLRMIWLGIRSSSPSASHTLDAKCDGWWLSHGTAVTTCAISILSTLYFEHRRTSTTLYTSIDVYMKDVYVCARVSGGRWFTTPRASFSFQWCAPPYNSDGIYFTFQRFILAPQ